jgi:hypothetical protein
MSQVDLTLERPLPHNLEAERAILGAVVLVNHALIAAVEKLRPEDFFLSQNRSIFAAMIHLAERQQGIDTVTLMEELTRQGILESAGGASYLSQLADGLPRITNVEHYAQIVKEKAILRSLIYSTSAIREQALDAAEGVDAILDRAETSIRSLRELTKSNAWQRKFHTIEELPQGDVLFLIDRMLPEGGITYLGASAGAGKTWFALSMSRALTTGKKFLGVWYVPEISNVLYLCPEMNARAFRRRCERFGIREHFYCQTIADGAPLDLTDAALAAAVRELRPVVFLDTAIRFSNAEDENSAAENQALARALFALIQMGARGVVCLHHRAKDAGRAEEMTLENTLRGSGDSGAIAAAVYGLRYDSIGHAPYLKESRKLVRLQVRCVKSRDFCGVEDFRVQLEPFLDEFGDMAILADKPEQQESEGERLSKAIEANPKATKIELQEATGIGRNRIGKLAASEGWQYEPMRGWEKSDRCTTRALPARGCS